MFWIEASVLALVIIVFYFLCRFFKLNKIVSLFIITIIAMIAFYLTHTYLLPYQTSLTIEAKMRNKYPILDLIALRAADDFTPYLKKIQKDVLSNEDVDKKIEADTHQFLNEQLVKYYQRASNRSIYDYTIVIHAAYKKLAAMDPILVLAAEFPKKFPTNQVTYDEMDTKKMRVAKENIIRSAIETPAPPLTENEKQQAKTIVQDIILELAEKYGKENVVTTFEHPEQPTLDKKMGADILIEFYRHLIAKGVKETGLAMKFSLSPNSSD